VQDLLPLITGSGGALVVLAVVAWLLGTGKLHSDSEFRKVVEESDARAAALETERTINNELARAGGVTNTLIGALVQVATDRTAESRSALRAAIPDSGLSATDLGL
jgi:anaerobic C4-dicarboxylate transporter